MSAGRCGDAVKRWHPASTWKERTAGNAARQTRADRSCRRARAAVCHERLLREVARGSARGIWPQQPAGDTADKQMVRSNHRFGGAAGLPKSTRRLKWKRVEDERETALASDDATGVRHTDLNQRKSSARDAVIVSRWGGICIQLMGQPCGVLAFGLSADMPEVTLLPVLEGLTGVAVATSGCAYTQRLKAHYRSLGSNTCPSTSWAFPALPLGAVRPGLEGKGLGGCLLLWREGWPSTRLRLPFHRSNVCMSRCYETVSRPVLRCCRKRFAIGNSGIWSGLSPLRVVKRFENTPAQKPLDYAGANRLSTAEQAYLRVKVFATTTARVAVYIRPQSVFDPGTRRPSPSILFGLKEPRTLAYSRPLGKMVCGCGGALMGARHGPGNAAKECRGAKVSRYW